jgi:hypothetical protein
MELFRKHGPPLEAGVRALAVAKDAKTLPVRQKKHALELVRNARAQIASVNTTKPARVDANWSDARINQLLQQLAQAEFELRKAQNYDEPRQATMDRRSEA